MEEEKKKRYPGRIVLWILVILGFMLMEFPGVFFFNRVEPMIFNMPFIYGFNIIIWAYMCVVLFIAYRTNWGKGWKNNSQGNSE